MSKIRFTFDDDPTPLEVAIRPVHERQDIALGGRKAKKIHFAIADWEKTGAQNVLGIDNIWLYAQRDAAWRAKVRPLLNIGGLVAYNLGKGGLILNQLNVLEQEANPVNAQKKAAITKAILANLGAQFAGGIAPGTRLKSTPIAFPEGTFNLYTSRAKSPGWWQVEGDADLTGLPSGDQTLGGIGFRLADFRTSPVPGAAAVKGAGSPVQADQVVVPVGRNAAALAFLHTFHPGDRLRNELNDQVRDRRGWRDDPPAVAYYRIAWADGQTEDVPVVWGRGIAAWRQRKPASLAQAALAWSGPGGGDQRVATYAFRWDNPRPGVAIASVTLLPGVENGAWGTPVLLGVSALDPQNASPLQQDKR
jgi:beta-galactosidase